MPADGVGAWRNRIVGHDDVPPGELVQNPATGDPIRRSSSGRWPARWPKSAGWPRCSSTKRRATWSTAICGSSSRSTATRSHRIRDVRELSEQEGGWSSPARPARRVATAERNSSPRSWPVSTCWTSADSWWCSSDLAREYEVEVGRGRVLAIRTMRRRDPVKFDGCSRPRSGLPPRKPGSPSMAPSRRCSPELPVVAERGTVTDW